MNSLGLGKEFTSKGHAVVSQPPSSDLAYIQFNPQTQTVFASRDGFQAARDNMDFEFHGFKDVSGIEVRNLITISDGLFKNISDRTISRQRMLTL